MDICGFLFIAVNKGGLIRPLPSTSPSKKPAKSTSTPGPCRIKSIPGQEKVDLVQTATSGRKKKSPNLWHKITQRWEWGNSTPLFPSQAFSVPSPRQSHLPALQLPEVNISQFHSPKSFLVPQRGSPAAHGRYLNETLSSNPQHLAGRQWQPGGCFAPGNYLFSLIISILFGSVMPGCSLCLIQRPSREMTLWAPQKRCPGCQRIQLHFIFKDMIISTLPRSLESPWGSGTFTEVTDGNAVLLCTKTLLLDCKMGKVSKVFPVEHNWESVTLGTRFISSLDHA